MKEEKKQPIYTFFIKMFFIFLFIDIGMMLVAELLTSTTSFYKYGSDLITEMFYALTVLIVMLLFKNSYVFTDKKTKFIDGINLYVDINVEYGCSIPGVSKKLQDTITKEVVYATGINIFCINVRVRGIDVKKN